MGLTFSAMGDIQIFKYNNTPVTFQNGERVMVNATEMARSFGKRPIDWLQNQQTKEFLSELSKVRKSTLADLVVVTKGGNNAGTWMHEDVALEFARWLNPAFAIWCNDRIRELVTTGVATIKNDDEAIAYAMQVLTKRLEAAKKSEALLEQQNKALQAENEELRVKSDYVEKILASKELVTITQIAADYGMSAKAFNKKLAELKVQRKVNGQWILYAPHSKQGYVHSRTINITHRDGSTGSVMHTEWRQKGRLFLYETLKKNGILPLIERA